MTAAEYNLGRILAGELTLDQITELVRQFQLRNELLPDAKFGPATASQLDQLMQQQRAPDRWGDWAGPLGNMLPGTREEYYAVFGNPGSGSLSRAWYDRSIVELHQNLGNQLPGAPPWQYIKVHEKLEPYAREALRRCAVSCPEYVIERLGSFNYRHKQRDTRKQLSAHAFGAALDVNPNENRAVYLNNEIAPWTPEWNAIWPNSVPAAFVQAMESCGWAWGGWWQRPCDPMHFEIEG